MSNWTNGFEWAEDLPEECPPEHATNPNGETYYRMVETVPPTITDFRSSRVMYPDKSFKVDECRARSCSLFSDLDACMQKLKLPTQKGKKIVMITLDPTSGVLAKTGGKNHFSWWIFE